MTGTRKTASKIILTYKDYRGKKRTLTLISENLHSFKDPAGRVFGSLAMAKAAHRTGTRITSTSKSLILLQ
jgi:hypothetical protein